MSDLVAKKFAEYVQMTEADIQRLTAKVEELEREKEAFRKAGTILLGCLNDAKELGLTVAVCGIEPDVMTALESAASPTASLERQE